jgi:uncharacterized protein
VTGGAPVTAHLRGDLAELVGATDHEVTATERRSVKDVVESLGVPHTEVGALVVDGVGVGFDHLVAGGEAVEVHPVRAAAAAVPLRPPAPEPRRFACDVHLGTLARRLRLLGFDTWYRRDAVDRRLAELAVDEARILLTRDRGLLMRRIVVHGQLPRCDDPDGQLAEVVARYGLADRVAPLTRCIPCNGPLHEVAKAEVVERLPPRTRRDHDRFVACADCGQVFWPGSHLDALNDLVDRVTSPT